MARCPAHGNRIQQIPSGAVNQIGATPQPDCRGTLGLDPGEHRIEWAEADVTDGAITLEVTSAAYVQAWEQEGLSVISFPIEQRVATAYVFCLLAEQDPEGGIRRT